VGATRFPLQSGPGRLAFVEYASSLSRPSNSPHAKTMDIRASHSARTLSKSGLDHSGIVSGVGPTSGTFSFRSVSSVPRRLSRSTLLNIPLKLTLIEIFVDRRRTRPTDVLLQTAHQQPQRGTMQSCCLCRRRLHTSRLSFEYPAFQRTSNTPFRSCSPALATTFGVVALYRH